MKTRLARLGLGVSLAVVASVPLSSTPANAWACLDDVTRALCFVVGTTCRTYGEVTGNTEICSLG